MLTCKNPKCKKPDAGSFHVKGNFIPAGPNEIIQTWMCLYCLASFPVRLEIKEDKKELIESEEAE